MENKLPFDYVNKNKNSAHEKLRILSEIKGMLPKTTESLEEPFELVNIYIPNVAQTNIDKDIKIYRIKTKNKK